RRAAVGGLAVIHLSGKGAAGRLAEACASGALVVLAAVAEERPAGCLLIDQRDLRHRGAMAGWVENGAIAWRDAAGMTGARLWSAAAVRQQFGSGRDVRLLSGREGSVGDR
ncbi:MAG TPA: hypothetical protein PLL33_09415, partial [Paracoccus sp. (in: a-proteobacteria)]|nr:hypothetical protein [Paracoccus sp. (in: a-proteobacteria)]